LPLVINVEGKKNSWYAFRGSSSAP